MTTTGIISNVSRLNGVYWKHPEQKYVLMAKEKKETKAAQETKTANEKTEEPSPTPATALPVGTQITNGNGIYTVVGDKTVRFAKMKDKMATSIEIPEKIVVDDISYTVTVIAQKTYKKILKARGAGKKVRIK